MHRSVPHFTLLVPFFTHPEVSASASLRKWILVTENDEACFARRRLQHTGVTESTRADLTPSKAKSSMLTLTIILLMNGILSACLVGTQNYHGISKYVPFFSVAWKMKREARGQRNHSDNETVCTRNTGDFWKHEV